FRNLSGKIRLSLLDADFQNVVDFLNSTLSYSNYVVDSGSVNHLVVAFAGGITYTDVPGQIIFAQAANTNTGASDIVVNGSSAIPIVPAGGAALGGGGIVGGYVYI